MSESRFGYPNVKVGELSNEQNIQNMKSFCFEFSNNMEYYVAQQEEKIDALTEAVKSLSKG